MWVTQITSLDYFIRSLACGYICSKIVILFCHPAGEIPDEIRNLTNVKNIYLDYNQLSGDIPKSIGKLTTLQELSLANNNLGGIYFDQTESALYSTFITIF